MEKRALQSIIGTVGRALLASLFIVSGVRKAMGFAGAVAYINSKGLPAAEIVAAATIALEIGGGVLLVLNILRAPVAFLFAAFCLASAVMFHDFWAADAAQYSNQLNHFLKNVALAGAFLALAAIPSRQTD